MFSWLTSSKMEEDAAEDKDDTCIEPPETPAPVFAMRAVKHAIWGTPQPQPVAAPRLAKKRKLPDTVDALEFRAPSDAEAANYSPTKAGILMTPGTVRGKKKEVTFGVQVMDNENKKPSRSGLPNDCPGKFPSPWTPKVTKLPDEKRTKSKLTEALYEAKATGTTPKRQKARSKDDTDITIDIMEPRSESGRHWKEQYISYHKNSEEQIGKLTAKYKLCKEHAKRKDEEANEYKRQLESTSKRHRIREKELERQIKELREQLRLQMAENIKATTEISVLRQRVGDNAAETSTEKLKRALLKREATGNDAIWVDEAIGDNADNAKTRTYLQAAVVQIRGEQARLNRGNKEQRLARKVGTIARQDSVVTPNAQLEIDTSDLDRSPTPRASRDVSKPLRRILADMSPNIPSSPPMPSFFSESDHEKIITKVTSLANDKEQPNVVAPSTTHREAMAEAAASLSNKRDFSILEDLAPMSALSLQAEQPTTPRTLARDPAIESKATAVSSSKRHKRSEATSLAMPADLPEKRTKSAQERIDARRVKTKRQARLR